MGLYHNQIADLFREIVQIGLMVILGSGISICMRVYGLQTLARQGLYIVIIGALFYTLPRIFNGEVFGYKDGQFVLIFLFCMTEAFVIWANKAHAIRLFSWLICGASLSRIILLSMFFTWLFTTEKIKSLGATILVGGLLIILLLSGTQVTNYWNSSGFVLSAFADYFQRDLETALHTISQVSNPSDKYRFGSIVRALEYFKQNPLLGIGIGNLDLQTMNIDYLDGFTLGAHSEIFRVLAEGGLVYLILYVIFLIKIFPSPRIIFSRLENDRAILPFAISFVFLNIFGHNDAGMYIIASFLIARKSFPRQDWVSSSA